MNSGRKKRGFSRVFLWTVFCIGVLLAFAYSILFRYHYFTLAVTPVGEQKMVLSYGETYHEEGAFAKFYGSHFLRHPDTREIRVDTSGTVDTTKVGTYTITYSADYFIWHTETVRTIQVVDQKAPVLKLNGDELVYVLPGMEYTEPGFEAYDDYDGDLTGSVTVERDDTGFLYTVTDSSGNTAKLHREVYFNDTVAPKITLEGGEAYDLILGKTFVEPGYKAIDNCDGDISDKVTVEGDIDSFKKGIYPITYTVTDVFGNTTVVTRNVNVIAAPQPERIVPDGKVVYLTFDDGPGQYTEKLLAVLAKYDVKATFFVTGNGDPEIIAKIAEGGHTVAIHTNSHNYRKIYTSEEAYVEDLLAISQVIEEQTGKTPDLIRFPGGSSNTVSKFNPGIMTRLTTLVEEMGYRYFDWNVDSNDAGGATSADEVYRNVVRGIASHDISVVLQHDIKGFSVAAVESIIEWGLRNGYTFLPLERTSPTCEHRVNN